MPKGDRSKPKWVTHRMKPGEGVFRGLDDNLKKYKRPVLNTWAKVASQDWTFVTPTIREAVSARIQYSLNYKKGRNLELAAGQVEHLPNTTAVDFSKEMLYKNPAERRLLFDLSKLRKNKQLPLKAHSYNSVVMSFGINYLDNYPAIITEAKRLLKKNGRIFIIGGVGAGLAEAGARLFEPNDIAAEMEKQGLRVHVEDWGAENASMVIIQAGENLKTSVEEEREEIFRTRWAKREEQHRKQWNEREKFLKERPKQFNTTLDYWSAHPVIANIERRLSSLGIDAKLRPYNQTLNVWHTERKLKTETSPWGIQFELVTKDKVTEKQREEIRKIADEELKKEYGPLKFKEFRAWAEDHGRPDIWHISTETEYKEKERKLREYIKKKEGHLDTI